MLRNRYLIDAAPLQAYYSALVFAPKQSLTRRLFSDGCGQYLDVLPKKSLRWGAEVQKLEEDDERVTPVDSVVIYSDLYLNYLPYTLT